MTVSLKQRKASGASCALSGRGGETFCAMLAALFTQDHPSRSVPYSSKDKCAPAGNGNVKALP